MLRNKDVLERWKYGYTYLSGRSSLTTDGKLLYSYNTIIGYTDNTLGKISISRNRKDGGYISPTVSKHSKLAKEFSDISITFNQYKQVVEIAQSRLASKK